MCRRRLISRRPTSVWRRSIARLPAACASSSANGRIPPPQRVLIDIALVEREVDRARRAFGMFFEVFSQRGSTYAPGAGGA